MIREEKPIFWETILSLIAREKVRMNISLMRMATEIELFESIDTKAL
jgi:hypothetical protein